jgi:hypothetical protein
MYELKDDELDDRARRYQKNPDPILPSPIVMKNMKKASDNGLTIVAGTDAGNVGVLHGPSLYREFLMMRKAGMTNHQILVSATLNSARMLKTDKWLGSIENGKLADIVILNSNPLDSILNTSDVFLVLKNGKVYDPSKVLVNKPEDLAQIQLNAYNAKDIESFLAVYSDDVEIFKFPDSLLYKGKDKMREVYTTYFNKAGNLHCKLDDRLVYGNYVFDKEDITTSIPGREHFNGQAIYFVKDGLIRKVWFVK